MTVDRKLSGQCSVPVVCFFAVHIFATFDANICIIFESILQVSRFLEDKMYDVSEFKQYSVTDRFDILIFMYHCIYSQISYDKKSRKFVNICADKTQLSYSILK